MLNRLSNADSATYAISAFSLLLIYAWQLIVFDGGLGLVAVTPFSDAYVYHYSAWFKAAISDQSFVSRILALSPYEMLLFACISVFGHSNLTPFVVNALLSILTCLLLIKCTNTLFSKRASIACAALYILCEPILFFSGTTLKTNLVLFLTAVSFFASIKFFTTNHKRWLIIFCVSIFICAIDRVHILVIPFAFILVLSTLTKGLRNKQKLFYTLICITCFAAMFTLSHIRYGSEPKFLSPVGLNIYLGHTKPDNFGLRVEGVRNHILGHREDARKVAEKALKTELTNAAVTQYWLDKTLSYIRDNPSSYLTGQWQKARQIVSPSSYSSQESYYFWRKDRGPLQFTFVNFSIVFALFVIGIVLLRRGDSTHRVEHKYTYWAAISYLAGLMATIVIERYRLPAFIFMLPIAGFALSEILYLNKGRLLFIGLFTAIILATIGLESSKSIYHDSEYLAEQEVQEALLRSEQESWFKLRDQVNTSGLSREKCYSLQNELIAIAYNRDLKAVALACAEY